MISDAGGCGDPLSPEIRDNILEVWNSGVPFEGIVRIFTFADVSLIRQAITQELQRRIQARQRGRLPGGE